MFCSVLCALLTVVLNVVNADVYFQIPRGSNNRLDGNRRERRNANRLFDSQNNNRGGYNVGRDKIKVRDSTGRERTVTVGEMKYYVGSILSMQWTNQHECGGSKTRCNIIIQYMCDDNIRDGTTTSTIPSRNFRCPRGDCNSASAKRFGQHEDMSYYYNCIFRKRNEGLFKADQKLKGSSAKYTRQNPNGQRRGLECPEERDYYPYSQPTPWRDIVIFTNQLDKCALYQAESQNTNLKYSCHPPDASEYFKLMERRNNPLLYLPNNKAECEAKLWKNKQAFKWLPTKAFDLPVPECLEAPKSRDNHLGNGGSGPFPNIYNWTVPNTPAEKCVLRIRYNISTGDVPDELPSNENTRQLNVGSDYGLDKFEARERDYLLRNNPTIKPLKTDDTVNRKLKLQLNINTAQFGRTFEDRSHAFSIVPRPPSIPPEKPIYNLNVKGKRGNIVQVFPATEYDFAPNNLQILQGDYVHLQWTGSLRNPQNNDGEGKKGTDKSNAIALAMKLYPEGTGDNILQPLATIGHLGRSYPLSLKSKNTFLSLPYNKAVKAAILVPDKLGLIKPASADVTSKDAEEKAEDDIASPSNNYLVDEIEDIAEEVASLTNSMQENDDEIYSVTQNDPASRRRRRRRSSTRRRSSSSSARRRRRRSTSSVARRLDLATLNDAPAYFDLDPVEASSCNTYYYMCTRNNNFSNRSQKGIITVSCPAGAER